MTTGNIVLLITALATALIGGLFYSYSCSINWGLRNLSDAGYVGAMQAINKAILNPLFFASFMGTLILLPLSAYLHYNQPLAPRFLTLLISAIIYIIGVFGVTIFGNVPLNEALAGFDLHSASPEEITRQRESFEGPWNKLHTIRTIASVVSLVLVILACMSESLFTKDANGS